MKRVFTIIDKEWSEIFKIRIVLLFMTFVPVLFILMGLGTLLLMDRGMSTADVDLADVPQTFLAECGDDMTAADCMQIYIVNQFLLMFLMLPVIIPITIASYSIVGEKTTHSLEPLLATPITTIELLVGKGLAAVLPSIMIGWASFGIFLIGLPLIGVSRVVFGYIVSPTWLLAILVVGPLMAIASVNFAIYVSSRVNDPRVAEQIAALLIIPIVVLMVAQLIGLVIIDIFVMLSFIGAMILIDIGLVYLGVTIFERETILTRWK